jgi:hypothetical protein
MFSDAAAHFKDMTLGRESLQQRSSHRTTLSRDAGPDAKRASNVDAITAKAGTAVT